MGLGERLKDIYYAGEEKWYNFWDKVDAHIPIYKLIDPIDAIVPSFALFLILIFILLLVFSNIMFGAISAGQTEINVQVVDNFGSPVEGATVKIAGIDKTLTTDVFGLTENVTLNYGQINATATKGDKTATDVFYLEVGATNNIQLVLPSNVASFSQKSIMFKTESGELATGKLDLTFACSSGVTDGVPTDQTIFGGTTNVAQPDSCGTLTVSVSSPKYTTDTFTLSGASGNFVLSEKVAKTQVKVVVNLTYLGANITDAVSVQAYSTGNSYIPMDTEVAVNGQATFDLIEGDYTFKTAAEKGYKAASSSLVSLTKEGGQKNVTIALEKKYLGSVSALIKEGSKSLEGVRVALTKETTSQTAQEIWAYDTNSTGEVNFDVSEEGPFTIIATKDGYCDKSISAAIGDSIVLSLKKYDGTCGHELKVKVIDSDGKAVQFAKVAIFSQTTDDLQKLSYAQKITDFNGKASWSPVRKTADGETYKVFAFKSVYSGWSEAKELNATTSADEFVIRLDIPMGLVRVIATDMDDDALQFSEVQIFDEYNGTAVSGKRMIENVDGTIDFNIKADKMVYVVVKKEGYESYTTVPKQIIGNGTIVFEAQLSRPPVEALVVKSLGLYKNGERAQKVEANQEYDALFEITAPKAYDELGFFVRVGPESTTKTEQDHIFIKNIYAGGQKTTLTGATYNKPKGYSIDEDYLNLEENKWAQVQWQEGGFVEGKIIVGVKVKIKSVAQTEERIDLGYRVWGVMDGSYERDPFDSELGTSENKSGKQALYALAKPDYITVGTETLCDKVSEERNFCLTSTITNPEGFTTQFNDTVDTLNNTPYQVSINVMNNSIIGFDNAKIMLENPEENIMLDGYVLKTPKNETRQSDLNNSYKTDWIDVSGFGKGLSIDIMDLNIIPQKSGAGTLVIKIREQNSLIFEKTFSVNISSDKKLTLTYMSDSKFSSEMPKIISGKFQILTIKARNAVSNLEVSDALVKVFDRFGTKIFSTTTNALGVASIDIPASFPGEKLTLKVEKSEFETFITEFGVAEDVVTIEPTELNYTVNPQSKKEEIQTVKLTNSTGLDLKIKSIKLTGKLKGALSESKMESWFDQYIGKTIAAQDFEEFDFKVISSDYVPSATDLDGVFQVTLTSEGKSWVQEVNAKIRVGLGKDVDNQSCLQITPGTWAAQTRGNMIELGVELKNNCTVDSKPVQLKNLGLTLNSTGSIAGDFTAIYKTAQVEIGSAYSRVLKPTVAAGEKIPITLRFVPLAGSSGTATGSIVMEAQNNTDSAPQKITTEVKFTIDYENLQDCMSLGTGLVDIKEGESGTFSIISSCKFASDIQLDLGDMQAAVSDKTFALKAGETKEVTINAQVGQMPGAYNILVYARQPGSSLELLDNVKVIVEPVNSCFSLTRYEYDVYDSQFNNFDGVDRGYLKNDCVEKSVSAHVTGIVPFDNWQSILTAALIGGISGGVRSGKIFPDWISNLWSDDSKNNGEKASNTKSEIQKKLADQALASAKKVEGIKDQASGKLDKKMNEYDSFIKTVDDVKAKAEIDQASRGEPTQCDRDYIDRLDALKAEAAKQKEAASGEIAPLQKKLDTVVKDIQKTQQEKSAQVDTKAAEILTKINAGQAGAEQSLFEFQISADKIANESMDDALSRTDLMKEFNAGTDKVVSKVDADIKKLKGDLGKAANTCTTCLKEKGITVNENDRYTEICNEEYSATKKGEDVIKYSATECPGVYSSFFSEESDPSKGYCCFSKESPTSMCLTKPFAQNLMEAPCNEFGLFNIKVEGLNSKYYCCTDEVTKEAQKEASDLKAYDEEKQNQEEAAAASELEVLTDQITPPSANTAIVDPMSSSFVGYYASDGKKYNGTNDVNRKRMYVTVAEFANDEFTNYYCTFNIIGDGANLALVKPNGAADCSSSAGESIKALFESKDELVKAKGYCVMTKDKGVAKLICNDLTLFSVKNSSGRVLGFTSNSAEGQAMLESYNNASLVSASNTAAQSSATTYTVKAGEDLYTVAIKCGVSPADIRELNGLTGTAIAAGTVLKIPADNSCPSSVTGNFLLTTSTAATSTTATTNGTSTNTSIQDVMGQGLFSTATSAVVGMFGGSALGGAAIAALVSLMQAKDTTIDFSDTFNVPKVIITGFDFKNSDGITVNTFDANQKIYNYSSCSGVSSTTSSSTSSVSSIASLDSSYAGTVLYNPQALNATIGLEEEMELEFTNTGKKVNQSPNQPFVGVLKVDGQEAIYDTDYNYDSVKTSAQNRGDNLKIKRSGIFGTILNYIGGPGLVREKTATMTADDLTTTDIRAYSKSFHLLFDSYEYVDCGPTTYPCTAKAISNCDIDGKNGYTGAEGVPKMKLAWNWNDIGINECDSDSNPDNYNYCDSTQFSIMLLKRMMDMKEFFNSTSLNACPTSAEIAGTKTQDLASNDLDVGITSVTVKSLSDGATITAAVQTNNNLEMSATMKYAVKKSDGNEISGVCPDQTNTFKSSTEFSCTLNKSITGEGSFNVDLIMTPALCSGCGNRSTGNDTIRTTVIIGSTGASQCLKYATSKDYFEKVLAANNQLSTAGGDKVLKYISFKANLLRDGFSNDFKADFDEFLNRVTSAPVEYNTGGFRDLLLSDKFTVKWPNSPAAWDAGKYDATITITFKNENWRWDNNNIESIVVNLSPQGPPEPNFAIYNVAFNGVVGLDSDNGRQGYGAGYEQLTEDLFLVTNNGGTKVYARPNASNNAATTVQVSTIKGVAAFDLLNTVPTRGNVLSISGDDVVQFVLTPSIAIPIIMNVTRNTSTDAYAFYSAEVNGQPENTGGSFISWTGIGQGCVDFEGRSMSSYSNTYDTFASGSVTGFTGYGLPAWTMAQRAGTASFYGTFFAPQDASIVFKLTGANESANFESTMGNGTVLSVNSTNVTDKIETLSDVLDLVKQEKVCVVGGDYYWNNTGLSQELKATIDAKENTCIPSR